MLAISFLMPAISFLMETRSSTLIAGLCSISDSRLLIRVSNADIDNCIQYPSVSYFYLFLGKQNILHLCHFYGPRPTEFRLFHRLLKNVSHSLIIYLQIYNLLISKCNRTQFKVLQIYMMYPSTPFV